jgi:8-oxo-dGTP pyrophosphatase MutT (NUDIX family)/phosphohistidine phosphatase SixA
MADTFDLIRAAGAVVWRGPPDDPQVALIHRPRYDDWTLPKGKLEPGEHVLLATVREVWEETGSEVTLGRPLPPQGYLRDNLPKRVDYWAASISADTGFYVTDEVDDLAWLPLAGAMERLTYRRDALTLAGFAAASPDTVPLIFVRHARAGDRRRWSGADRDRPLDATGEEQAAALAELLGCFGPRRLISSPAKRCVQTLEWYADSMGAEIEISKALSLANEAEDWRELVEELIDLQASAVLCGHGEELPRLLAWTYARLGAAPPAEPWLAKGEFEVLHLAAGDVVGSERHTVD